MAQSALRTDFRVLSAERLVVSVKCELVQQDFFSRQDAKFAKVRIFAQSGDDDWAKDLVFKRAMFLFFVVSRQTKKGKFSTISAVNFLMN